MVFKKMLSAFGVGGPTVDTVLSNPNTRPGLSLDGHVNLRGGETEARIEQISLALVTQVEIEGGGSEYTGVMEFHRMQVAGAMQLAPGQQMSIPFQLPVPWETPITDVYGQRLRGMTMGLRTELAVARAVDKSDLDLVSVHPLPVHEKILEAFSRLGFQFKKADVERGHIRGVRQTLPFYQEIEFFAAPQYAHAIKELELTFITNPHSVDVVIECDRRGGMFGGSHDTFGRYVVEHANVDQVDWTRLVEGWISQMVSHYGSQFHPGGPAFHGHSGHRGGHGRGSGMGGVVAGAALGLAGGMIAGEIMDDMFDGGDDDGGDFGE
ncbi:sporulation protein [Micromonospora sp. NPDC003197]